jgi:LacI family transcriptional regulator
MLKWSVDGVAIMTSEMDVTLIAQLEKRRIPIVFLDTGKVRDRISNIKVDSEQGFREGVEYLFHQGHKRIGFVSGPLDLRSARVRQNAFLKWLHHLELPCDENLIQTGNNRIDGGEAAMERLLALPQRPTAVLSSNDLTAIVALRATYKAHLRVPGDISGVGFDDIGMSEFTQPALCTIRLSRAELAEKALDALRKVNRGKSRKGHEYHVETHLIVRGSTGKCPEATGL